MSTVSRRARPRGRRQLFLAFGLLVLFGAFRQVPAWNELSRYDLVRAVVDDGSLSIDRYEGNTGDKAFHDGHYYSDKAPGSAILGLPAYVVVTAASNLLIGRPPDIDTTVAALAFVASGIPTVVLVLLLVRFLRTRIGEPWALVIGVGYALGTMALPFATMYFGHAASAAFLFAAFTVLDGGGGRPGDRRALAAGFLAGCAALTELPVVLGVLVLGAYAAWRSRRAAALFIVGGLPLLAILLAYNAAAFGSPFTLGYQLATVFGDQNSRGIVSVVWPSPAAAVDLLIGPRGLLRTSPWLALAPLGLLAARRSVRRPEVVVSAAVAVVFLAYNAGALNPFGGWTPGPRYLLPALPFVAVLVALAPARVRPLTAILIGISAVLTIIGATTMPNAPEAFRDPFSDLWLPRFLGLDLAITNAWLRFGLDGAAVLAVLAAGVALAAVGAGRTLGFGGRRIGVAERLAMAGLVVLVGAVAFPLVPAAALDPGRLGVPGADGGPAVEIDGAGVARIIEGGRVEALVHVLVHNAGATLEGAQVEVSAHDASGAIGWSVRVLGLGWQAGTRGRVAVTWDLGGVPPGTATFDVRVVAGDGTTELARRDAAATLAIR